MATASEPPINISPEQDKSQQSAFLNTNLQNLSDALNPLLVKDDTGMKRVLAGKGANGFYGLKVSKPGFDVYDTADTNLIFNSNQNMFKIVTSGNATVTVPDPFPATTNRTTSVAHGLGYRPIVTAWVEAPSTGGFSIDGQTTAVPATASFTGSPGNIALIIYINVDNTNITFNVRNVAGVGLSGIGPNWVFKYYIMQETAA